MNDVGKNRAAEQALRESENTSEAKYRQLVNMSPEAIVVHRNGKILYTNPSAIQLFGGKGTKDFYGKPVLDFVHPDFNEKILARIQKVTTDERPAPPIEEKLLKLNGEEFEAEVTGAAVDYEGEPAMIALIRDISDRKQAEQEIRGTKERLYRVIDEAPIPIMIHADDGEILMLNRKWCELSGYSLVELPSLEIWIAKAYGKDKQKIRQIMKDFHGKDGLKHDGEFTLRIADGSKRIWDFRSTQMGRLPDGRGFIVSMATDVTDSRQEELRSRTLIEYSPTAVYLFDDKMRFIDSNPAGERLLGYSRSELLSMHILQVDVNPEVTTSAHEKLARGEPLINFEHQLYHKDGRIITVLNNSVALKGCDGEIINWYSFLMDITERKVIEEKLNEERELMKEIADSIPGVPYIYDLVDSRVVYTSRSLARILGYSADEILDMDKGFLQYLMHPDDLAKYSELIRRYKTATDEDVFETEYRLRHANGKWRWFVSRSTVFIRGTDGQPRQIIGTAQDITERKQTITNMERLASENRRLLQELILAQERERYRIAQELHDELGQNLTVIKTETARALARCQGNSELAGILHEIDAAISDVFVATRNIHNGLRPTMIDSLGLKEALRHLVQNWKMQGIQYELKLNGALDELENEFSLAIYRILQECLTNISRHASASRVGIQCIRQAKKTGKGELLHLIVEDNGMGMDADTVSGGFGLISMRERSYALGGTFSLQSTPGAGTRITVELPVSRNK